MNEEQEILMNEEISAATGGWPGSSPEAAAGSSWEDANKGFYIGLLHVPEPESAMVVGERWGSVINRLQAETRKKQLNGELQ